jgi:hypothetical protein
LLLEVRKNDDDTEVASNAFSERRKRNRAHAVARMKPGQIFLVVHRLDDSVYFRRLDRDEFAILSGLRAGKSLSAAIETGLRKSSLAPNERAEQAERWFRTWAALGWFCRKRAHQGDRPA